MAIVRVQGNARGASVTATISVTMASPPTSGNVLVLVYGSLGGVAYIKVTSISQVGVTWTQQVSKVYTDDTRLDSEIWFGVVGAGADDDLTVNTDWASGAVYHVADVCEYSGVLTASFLDKTATDSGHTATPTTGTTAATTQNDELWIGTIDCSKIATDCTQSLPTNGFTLMDGAFYSRLSVSYLEKIVSATGAASAGTTSAAGALTEHASCIATFKAAAAPPTAVLRRLLMGVGL